MSKGVRLCPSAARDTPTGKPSAARSTWPPWRRTYSARPPAGPAGVPRADALTLVEAAADRLWTREGSDALAYLTGPRCLAPETIRAARLGWTPGATIPNEDRAGGFTALGVVIPWFASGRL